MAAYADNSVGDSRTTVYLIENYDYLIKSGAPIISPVAYIPIWMNTMYMSIFGIFAHLGMPAGNTKIWLFISMTVLAGIAFLYRWRPRESGLLPADLVVISGFYSGFLMYAVNYQVYLEFRAPGLTLQGRYLFPVVGPMYVLMSYYLIQLVRINSVRLGIFTLVTLVFICSDFPYFLSFATPDWFAGLSR
jgi:hypothetical protein